MNIELICEVCGNKFERRAAEVKRNKKKGRRAFCSLRCAGKENNAHLEPWKNKIHLYPGGDTQSSELSPFKNHLKCMRNRERKECFVSLGDLKSQWDKQKGICPFTGWELKQPKSTSKKYALPKTPDRASVDRIDSSLPYTKDNIQFVSLIANFAKNGWDEEELYKFCEAVVSHRKRK